MTDTLEQAQADGRAPWQDPVLETKQLRVFKDKYPVTQDHALVVPLVNTAENIAACMRYAIEMGNMNVESDQNDITGYNVGINVGASAGQTCMYPHVHLIFRRDGDCEDPRGGIRHCVPGKGYYDPES